MIPGKCARRVSLILILLLAAIPSVFSQKEKDKDKSVPPDAKPLLWREPTDVALRDLFLGPGGEELKPDVSQLTFVKDDQTGYSVKYHVKDAAGRKWVVKAGNEARPETAANRLLWAIGYATEIDYVVPCAHIPGAPKPRKDVPRCEKDGFADVRFEARPDDVKRLDSWAWKKNPFVGTKELNGLIVAMALLNNWDLKDINNVVLLKKTESGDPEAQYVISDLGATFGKTGGAIAHSRNEPEKFVKTKFVEGVEGGHVRFAFSGKQGELLDKITVADAKWIGSLLSQLTDQQLQDAFRASDFKAEEIEILVPALRDRINQLVNLPG